MTDAPRCEPFPLHMLGKYLADVLKNQTQTEADFFRFEDAPVLAQVLPRDLLEQVRCGFRAVWNNASGTTPDFWAGIIFHEKREPVFFGQTVVVSEGDDFARAMRQ